MISISEAVKTILKNSFFVEEALALKIINYSALARLLRPEIESRIMRKVDLNSIVMALRRHSQEIVQSDRKIIKWLQGCPDLLVRSNLLEMTFHNSETILIAQKEFLSHVENKKNLFFTVTRGVYETTIIASKALHPELKKVFSSEKLIAEYENLSALTLQLREGSALVPGIYSFILKALFCQGINVMEVVSTLNEFSLIVEEKFVEKAFATIKAIIKR